MKECDLQREDYPEDTKESCVQMALVTSIPDTSIYWLEAYLRPSLLNKHILITRIFL